MDRHGIVFDCDGTLVNSLGQALRSFNYALERMGKKALPPEEIKRHFGGGADRIFTALLGNARLGLEAFDHYCEHQSQLAGETRLHDGIRKLLETCAAHDVPLGVVTGRHARDLDILLAPHRVRDFFLTLVADNHLPRSKPAPDGILLAAEHLNLAPRQIIYVGDSVMDVRAAHSAGAHAVAALWDELADEGAMAAAGPEYFARTPGEVWSVFQEFTSRPR